MGSGCDAVVRARSSSSIAVYLSALAVDTSGGLEESLSPLDFPLQHDDVDATGGGVGGPEPDEAAEDGARAWTRLPMTGVEHSHIPDESQSQIFVRGATSRVRSTEERL
jgi:hypothetical protein